MYHWAAKEIVAYLILDILIYQISPPGSVNLCETTQHNLEPNLVLLSSTSSLQTHPKDVKNLLLFNIQILH